MCGFDIEIEIIVGKVLNVVFLGVEDFIVWELEIVLVLGKLVFWEGLVIV